MIWSKIESVIGENIPMCVKKVLLSCGYDTVASLENISREDVSRIGKHVNEYSCDVIQSLDCCHHEFYKEQKMFKFLPGHVDLLLILPKYIQHECLSKTHGYSNSESHTSLNLAKAVEKHTGFSVIMRELIYTVLQNENIDKNHTHHSEIIRFFATYIFIICGRSSYEVLYKNLPLLKTMP